MAAPARVPPMRVTRIQLEHHRGRGNNVVSDMGTCHPPAPAPAPLCPPNGGGRPRAPVAQRDPLSPPQWSPGAGREVARAPQRRWRWISTPQLPLIFGVSRLLVFMDIFSTFRVLMVSPCAGAWGSSFSRQVFAVRGSGAKWFRSDST